MAKEKRTCPCPTDMARAAVRSAKTCDQSRAAASRFLEAMANEVDAMAPSPQRDRLEARLFGEATRYEARADVRCQFPNKSPEAIEAIYRARLNLQRSTEAAARMRATLEEKRQEAQAAYSAAQQLAAYRRRRARARR